MFLSQRRLTPWTKRTTSVRPRHSPVCTSHSVLRECGYRRLRGTCSAILQVKGDPNGCRIEDHPCHHVDAAHRPIVLTAFPLVFQNKVIMKD